MLAQIATPDGPKLQEVDDPQPKPGQALVRIHAAALNRADLFMATGGSHGPAGGVGAVMGLEFAGERVDTGERVMGTHGASYAQYAAVDEGRLIPIPDGMSYEQAACLPVGLNTMHNAVVTNGGLGPGQAILIHGASSGVGLMGLQIAKLMGAGVVIGSSGDAGRRGRLKDFGADLAVDYKDSDWVEQVRAVTGGEGVDVVVDQISGPDFNRTMKATKVLGRIVNVGRLGGQTGEVDFNLHALKRITFIGVTFRTRSKAEVSDVVAKMRADLWAPMAQGKISLPIDQVFAFEALPDALARMSENRHFGKIVLKVS